MEESNPTWEDLNTDCLVLVFQRIGLESLILGVPFVCKSWYSASLNPQCWRYLCFPAPFDLFMVRFMENYHIEKHKLSVTGFVKLFVHRSRGSIAWLEIPYWCSELQSLESLSDELHLQQKDQDLSSEI
ncbi:F-box protein FBW2-like [Macadamia integrifolia]|uniref:F-box protein FBW2-like n=1 Tax=Macadamia integrifolia TaxID=60698 RepID=UPI001C4FBD36|nr:F-box protein FBW2-like [Macadamia integrifolia]